MIARRLGNALNLSAKVRTMFFLDGADRFFSCRKEKNKSFTGKTLAQKSISSCFAPVQDVKSLFKVIDASVSSKSKTDNALQLYDSASNHIWLSTIFVSTEIVKVLLSADKDKIDYTSKYPLA